MDGFMDVCRLSSFVLLVSPKEAPSRNFLLSAGMLLSNVIVSNGFSQNPSAEYKIITIVR
jgi:hypothetical protein